MKDQGEIENSQLIIYRTEDGKIKIDVRFKDETVWLSQKLLGELFQVSIPTINEHIKTIYEDGELTPGATIRKFRIVQNEGNLKRIKKQDERESDFDRSVKMVEEKAKSQNYGVIEL